MSMQRDKRQETNDQTTLPRNNVEWVEAIVKWTRYDHVAMYDYPTTNNSETVMEIYKGDMVQISRRYRREDWCLCQIGHVLGWVFLKDVRFIVRGSRSPRPNQYNLRNEEDTAPPHQDPQPQYEMRTEPAVRQQQEFRAQQIIDDDEEVETMQVAALASSGASDKKPLINRLINFFKR